MNSRNYKPIKSNENEFSYFYRFIANQSQFSFINMAINMK